MNLVAVPARLHEERRPTRQCSRRVRSLAPLGSTRAADCQGVGRAQHMVIAVFEAEGSYREVRHVQRALQGDGKLWIVIGKSSRPWSMINPASVIVVPRVDGEPVFLEAASQQAQDLLRGVGE
jgi:hypothetical protein